MIAEPILHLNENICKTNIHRMAEKAQSQGLAFKPHMKTHQSEEIGEWIRDAGAEGITVSSVKMARYFTDAGWNNIIIAFPSYPGQVNAIDELAANTNLTLLVNNKEVITALEQTLTSPVKAYIEIDTGSDRTGLSVNQKPEIAELINEIKSIQKLKWIGFYSHPGHSYGARSTGEIQKVFSSVKDQFEELRGAFGSSHDSLEVCVGDTPCCSVGTSFEDIDAISPGNFVFYDLMQAHIGSCEVSDIAVAMECPVVDKYPGRNEIAIHGGAVHFSKEIQQQDDVSHYGLAAQWINDHWEIRNSKAHIKALSQEHGILSYAGDVAEDFKVGDSITVLPIHSCLTANLMQQYDLTNGSTIHQMS